MKNTVLPPSESTGSQLTIADDGSYITVPLRSGPARFHALWLQDNAQDESSISGSNGQKLLTLQQQTSDPRICDAQLNGSTLLLDMQHANASQYQFSLHWLEQHRYDRDHQRTTGWVDDSCELWDSALQQGTLPTADYQQIGSDPLALMHWLRQIRRYGFAFLHSVGTEPGELLKVASLFGYTRETNYGRYFDVKTQINAENLAFTSLGLQAHTDNPYRHPVPSMQILTCLENSTAGGDSILVDGFHAARILREENTDHFNTLCDYCVRFRYSGGEQVRLSAKKPILEIAPDGELTAIRFNNRSIAPIRDIPFSVMPDFYAAYRHLGEIIERPALKLQFRLQPGELFIVNNMRVLHARTSYSSEGARHLQGCYPDIDGLLSTLSALEEKYEHLSTTH